MAKVTYKSKAHSTLEATMLDLLDIPQEGRGKPDEARKELRLQLRTLDERLRQNPSIPTFQDFTLAESSVELQNFCKQVAKAVSMRQEQVFNHVYGIVFGGMEVCAARRLGA